MVFESLVGVDFAEKVGTKEFAQFSVKSSKLVGKGPSELGHLAYVIGKVRNGELAQNLFDLPENC